MNDIATGLTELQKQYIIYLGGSQDDGRTLIDSVVADLAAKGLICVLRWP